MRDSSDMELVREFARHNADAAFAELVQRHVNLVYSVALRHIAIAAQAEEITQAVFVILARKAAGLRSDTVLAAWLYETARLTAISFLRGERRRQFREQEAYMQSTLEAAPTDSAWQQLAPLLDDAMMWLGRKDREAVVLRFFKDKDLREVAAALNINEAAAQKRVNRAVEKLRTFFTKRGVVLPAAALTAALSANAVQAAPVGLAVTISTAATLAGTTVAATATATAIKTIAMTTLQKTIIGATLAAAIGTGIYEARQASMLRTQVQALQEQQSQQIQQLQSERDNATSQLAALRDENERLKRNTTEISKLRGDAARLRQSQQELARLKAAASTAATLESRVQLLKEWLDYMPEKRIPEMRYATDADWLVAIKENRLETEAEVRQALSHLRNLVKNRFAPTLGKALDQFMKANDGNLPAAVSDLRPYLDPPVDDAILQRYKMLFTGKLADVPPPDGRMLIAENSVVDDEYDTHIEINQQGGQSVSSVSKFGDALGRALEAYAAANQGRKPTEPKQLLPYFKEPVDPAMLETFLQQGGAAH